MPNKYDDERKAYNAAKVHRINLNNEYKCKLNEYRYMYDPNSNCEFLEVKLTNDKTMYCDIEDLNLIGIDPWTKYSNWTQEKMDQRYQATLDRLKPYPNIKIIRKTSMDAVRDIKDGSLDFVYIDGFHDFDWIMSDLIFWSPKVRSGGIVAGHDYYPFYRAGIMTAVDAYVKGHNINTWYVTREPEPTFFWVKK